MEEETKCQYQQLADLFAEDSHSKTGELVTAWLTVASTSVAMASTLFFVVDSHWVIPTLFCVTAILSVVRAIQHAEMFLYVVRLLWKRGGAPWDGR